MVGNGVSGPKDGDRAGKRAGRRARGLAVVERGGIWYAIGTLRCGGRSIRLRKSLGLPAKAANYDAAWDETRQIERDIRAEVSGERPRGDSVAVAAKGYLDSPRKRPLGPSAIRVIKEIVAKFGLRRLNDIPALDWTTWIAARHAGNKAETREKFLNIICAFLAFARKHHRFTVEIEFARDGDARNPRQRSRRDVSLLRPELIRLLFDHAHISLQAQMAVEWSAGARVSSILYGVRVCDVILAPGREQVTFGKTKNGDDVVSALHPTAGEMLRAYAKWRGGLHNREAPFFLTYRRKPYTDNGKDGGGQNKTAFAAAKRRARHALLTDAFAQSRALRAAGRRGDALDVLLAARANGKLLAKVTQHWFRHLLATRMRFDLKSAMEQGGWRDERSVLGYVIDVPEGRRAIVSAFEDFSAVPEIAADFKLQK